jgi:hypothetical protein
MLIPLAGMVQKTTIFSKVTKLLSGSHTPSKSSERKALEVWAISLLAAIFRMQLDDEQKATLIRRFVTETLSTVYLEDTLSSESLSLFISALPLADFVCLLNDSTIVHTLDANVLFCNMTSLFVTETDMLNGDPMQPFLRLMCTLMAHIPEMHRKESVDDMDLDEISVEHVGHDQKAAESQKRCFGRLNAPVFLQHLAKRLCESTNTNACCSFLTTYISRFSAHKSKVLSVLALYRPSAVLGAIWKNISESDLHRHLHRDPIYVGNLHSSEEKTLDAWSCLILFSELYSMILLTVGDDEFFGPSPPVPISDILAYTSTIKVFQVTRLRRFSCFGTGICWSQTLISNIPTS